VEAIGCNLYLWNQDTKVVISDVDGTITKSDIMGHIMYFVGRDWTHVGVASLYTNIKVCVWCGCDVVVVVMCKGVDGFG
jgi:phosphatidate phosphatase PAH1